MNHFFLISQIFVKWKDIWRLWESAKEAVLAHVLVSSCLTAAINKPFVCSIVFKFKKHKICFRFNILMIISVHIKVDTVTQVCIQTGLFLIGKFKTSLTNSLHITSIGLKSIPGTKANLGLIWNCNYFWKKAELETNLSCYNACTFRAIICIWTWRNNALPILGDWSEVYWSGKREAGSPDKSWTSRTVYWHLQSCFLGSPLKIPSYNLKLLSGSLPKSLVNSKVTFDAQGSGVAPCSGEPFTHHTSCWQDGCPIWSSHFLSHPTFYPISPSLQGVRSVMSLHKGFWVLFLKN